MLFWLVLISHVFIFSSRGEESKGEGGNIHLGSSGSGWITEDQNSRICHHGNRGSDDIKCSNNSSQTIELNESTHSLLLFESDIRHRLHFQDSETEMNKLSLTHLARDVSHPESTSTTNYDKESVKLNPFEMKIIIECRFKEHYESDFDDLNSELSKRFAKNLTTRMQDSIKSQGLMRLVAIEIVSFRRGSVITTLEAAISSNTANNQTLSNVANATLQAFNGTLSMTDLNITTKILTNPSTSSATMTPSNSGTSQSNFVTKAPAKLGEYAIQINIIVSFNDSFILPYTVPTSKEYQNYINTIKMKYSSSSTFQSFLSLIDITFNSLSSGSVVANMQMNVASNSSDNAAIKNAVIFSTNTSFPSSIITSIDVNFVALIRTTPIAAKIQEWHVALISLLCIMVLFLFVIGLTTITIRKQSEDRKLKLLTYKKKDNQVATAGFSNDTILQTWIENPQEGPKKNEDNKN